jgi:cephalosporin hydroxylase
MPKRIGSYLGCLALLLCGCKHRKLPTISQVEMKDGPTQTRLLRGFYPAGNGSLWRWTSRTFAVSLDPPSTPRPIYLELDHSVPPELLNEVGSVTLIATVNGVEAGRQAYYKTGHYTFATYVPVRALQHKPAEVEFELDRAASHPKDGRLIGLNVVSAGFKEYEQTLEYRENQTWLARQGYQKAVDARLAQLPPDKERELRKLFTSLPVWNNLRFQNIRIQKSPLDLWMIQQILYEVHPDFVVVTGTGTGGFAVYLAQTLDGLNLPGSRILTIGKAGPAPEASNHFLSKKYVEYLRGDSIDQALASAIASRVKGRKTVVILDSDHTQEHVIQELHLYAPLVNSGSYIIVQDTESVQDPSQESYEAVRQFLNEGAGSQFELDPTREMAVFTLNPGGWLRRK